MNCLLTAVYIYIGKCERVVKVAASRISRGCLDQKIVGTLGSDG